MRLSSVLTAIVLFVSLPAVASASNNLLAEKHKFGAGLGGGSGVSGVTGKIFLGDALSAQATVGALYGFGIALNADALLEMKPFFDHAALGMNWYVGAGGDVISYSGFGYGSGLSLGFNAVVGVSAQLKELPVELTIEVRPTFWLNNDYGLAWSNGGGAVRYYF